MGTLSTYNRKNTTHVNLSHTGADILELCEAGWNSWRWSIESAKTSKVVPLLDEDLRCSQFRSATPRTSTSQHSGLPKDEEQSPAWRFSMRVAGSAMEEAMKVARARMVLNEVFMLLVVWEEVLFESWILFCSLVNWWDEGRIWCLMEKDMGSRGRSSHSYRFLSCGHLECPWTFRHSLWR